MRTRKNYARSTAKERQRFVQALLALKDEGRYDEHVRIYQLGARWARRGPAFFAWHRHFLLRFEEDLRSAEPDVTLPYWDFTRDRSLQSPLWADDFMGGDGRPHDGMVITGPFATEAGAWPLAGEGFLIRRLGLDPAASTLPTVEDLEHVLSDAVYDAVPWDASASTGFRNRMEGWVHGPALHNRVHAWVGGLMARDDAPDDPLFWLVHAFIDRLWSDWQRRHPGADYQPRGEGPNGHNWEDTLWPWNGGEDPEVVAPFGESPQAIRPRDLLDHRALGYVYDTDPEVGAGTMTTLAVGEEQPTFGFGEDVPGPASRTEGVSPEASESERVGSPWSRSTPRVVDEPRFTTQAVGEESPRPTTLAVGEEAPPDPSCPTTLAVGEERPGATTLAVGEEDPRFTTQALGEEGPPRSTAVLGEEDPGMTSAVWGEEDRFAAPNPGSRTTAMVGEEGPVMTTQALGEENPRPNPPAEAVSEEAPEDAGDEDDEELPDDVADLEAALEAEEDELAEEPEQPGATTEAVGEEEPVMTTQAVGEESPSVSPNPTTEAVGEEGPMMTTQAVGEESPSLPPRPTTLAGGEEGPVMTTQALGEESPPVTPRPTTLAVGEEGPVMTTLAVGEESPPTPPYPTTQAVGEEGPMMTTLAVGEESPPTPPFPTTLAVGEEGPIMTTHAMGEESPPVTTQAVGEEGPVATTQAVGEEGPMMTTQAVGEEGPPPSGPDGEGNPPAADPVQSATSDDGDDPSPGGGSGPFGGY